MQQPREQAVMCSHCGKNRTWNVNAVCDDCQFHDIERKRALGAMARLQGAMDDDPRFDEDRRFDEYVDDQLSVGLDWRR